MSALPISIEDFFSVLIFFCRLNCARGLAGTEIRRIS